MEQLKYPVLLFSDGYIYKANSESELTVHDRRVFADTLAKDWHIIDAHGSLFRVLRWDRVARQGIRAVGDLLFGNVIARPVLSLERQLTPSMFVQEIEPMLVRFKMYGGSYGEDEQRFVSDLRRMQDFSELFELLESSV